MLNGIPGAIEVNDLHKQFGRQPVLRGVDLHVAEGAVVALLGPSGCGKTTLLRTIAGLERADAGTVTIGGRPMVGPGTDVPPEKRRVGMVFQDWALFPHLDVGGNVGYGLPRKERTGGRVEAALELVGLGGMAKRQPGTLSGGQQQRVALARAIAPEPTVLLLDEPFSNLDTALRVQVRTEIHHLLVQLGITSVFVTHDQEEAFVLGDEVAVMADGEIVQQASPAELYAAPATPWVAGFVGDANLVAATAHAGLASTPVGKVPLLTAGTGPATVLLRAEQLHLAAGGDATVELTEFYGHDTVYLVRTAEGSVVRVRASAAPLHQRGDHVTVRYEGPPAISYQEQNDATSEAEGGALTPQPSTTSG
ncbi:MAG: ABC transporter ATP-binding protein [Acidimicrobiales bacterium]